MGSFILSYWVVSKILLSLQTIGNLSLFRNSGNQLSVPKITLLRDSLLRRYGIYVTLHQFKVFYCICLYIFSIAVSHIILGYLKSRVRTEISFCVGRVNFSSWQLIRTSPLYSPFFVLHLKSFTWAFCAGEHVFDYTTLKMREQCLGLGTKC